MNYLSEINQNESTLAALELIIAAGVAAPGKSLASPIIGTSQVQIIIKQVNK